MQKILFTGGLGDVLSVEARMTDAEKFAVREIFLATPGARFVKQALSFHYLWAKLPVVEILTKEQIAQFAPSKYCIHTLNELRTVCQAAHVAPPPVGVVDMGIVRIFSEIRSGARPWNKSGFAFPRFMCDLVVDYATTSGDFRISDRNFTEEEKKAVREYAKEKKRSMIELGEGKTTFEEFVGYTLGCREFIGVDSAASILAVIDKVNFPAKKVFIRSQNKAWYNHRAEWYAPAALDFSYGPQYVKTL